ncbi:hypothetical protein Daus18300_010266 [Diaporthe australafricana]|uniref:NACHT domain-containing protein n=1 Tax=Diaporthe australafricana TaxID=127596 RepID=A0ABR3WBA0_9PEZI
MSDHPGASSIQQILQQVGDEHDASIRAQDACLHDLYLTDPQEDRQALLKVKGPITSGTCNWVLSTPEYTQWDQIESTSSKLLWIYGGSGSGKTVLSIFLSKHLESGRITQDSAHCHEDREPLVLDFFCNGSDANRSTGVGILRGLLFQAIRQRPSLLGQLQREYEQLGNDLFQYWSFELLWNTFRAIILDATTIPYSGSSVEDSDSKQPRSPLAYIIVDGVDECEFASIRGLIQRLSRLGDDKEMRGRAKAIIISREQSALRTAFSECHLQLNLQAPNNADAFRADVQRHIQQQVDNIASPDRKDYSSELRKSVEDHLRQNSQANFLWVSLVMTELETTSRVEAWEHLSRLPSGLDAMYEWMMMQIPHEWRESSTKVLLWAALAYRPLSIVELVVALDEQHLGLIDCETVRDCVNHCGQILRTDADATVHLVHRSAQEYLLERLESSPSFFKDCVELNPFNLKEGHKLIAIICIENMTGATRRGSRDFRGQKQKNGKITGQGHVPFSPNTPTALLDYAQAFWASHVRLTGDLMLEVVDSDPQLFGEHSSMRHMLAYGGSNGLLAGDIPTLHYAAYHGLAPLVERLLKKRWWNKRKIRRLVGLRDSLGRTPLHLAVHRHDNGPIVELLLKLGADAASKDNTGATPFDYAAKYGTAGMFSLLPPMDSKARQEAD